MRTTFRVVVSLALFCLFSVSVLAQQPRRVLFETFTNSYDMCPEANGLDAAFKRTLASGNGPSLIHLNNHIANVGDPMVVAGSTANLEIIRLSKALNNPIFNGAVDHTVFSSTTVRITSKYEPGGESEWNNRITERLAELPLVSINLVDARIDKVGQADYWRLVATVRVSLQDDNNDSLRFFYAITEDNILFKQCESTKPVVVTNHNNVVRFIDVHGVPLALKDKQVGSSDIVTITHDISKEESYGYDLANMKLIAFVERGTQSTYEVVQAWELRKNFDTLQAPPQKIAISNANLDGKSYAPEDNIFITFDKTAVDSVRLEYSTNGGGTWQHIVDINTNRYFWKAPDITTTQGKIRVSELKTGVPSDISTGFFTIETPLKRIKILKPQGGDTAFLGTGKPFIVEWSKIGIDSIKLEYSSNGGQNWGLMIPFTKGTTFNWYPTGNQTEQALIRLTEVTYLEEKITTTSDPFYVLQKSSGIVRVSKIFSDIRIYPQPLSSGNALTLELLLASADRPVFTLYDMLGKEIYHEAGRNIAGGVQAYVLQLPSLSAGAYILSVQDSEGGRINKRIEIR